MSIAAWARDQHKSSLVIEVLRSGERVLLQTTGYSMLPTLWPGSTVMVRSESFENIQREDVILYHRGGRLFVHRVIGRSGGDAGKGVITRGDAMDQCDAVVSPDEFLGRIVAVRKSGGWVELKRYSIANRMVGLITGSSTRIRSVALRWHDFCNADAHEAFSR